MKTEIIITLISFVVVFLAWLLYARNRIIRIIHIKKLNKNRGPKDLQLFKEHYLSLGYSEEIIDLALKYLRTNFLTRHNFIPHKDDSFKKDYKWTILIGSQYSSYQMFFAGRILQWIKLIPINITEKDWNDFQKENGEIDNFDNLFKYVQWKVDKKDKQQKNEL